MESNPAPFLFNTNTLETLTKKLEPDEFYYFLFFSIFFLKKHEICRETLTKKLGPDGFSFLVSLKTQNIPETLTKKLGPGYAYSLILQNKSGTPTKKLGPDYFTSFLVFFFSYTLPNRTETPKKS